MKNRFRDYFDEYGVFAIVLTSILFAIDCFVRGEVKVDGIGFALVLEIVVMIVGFAYEAYMEE